jgi:hypothetical protein
MLWFFEGFFPVLWLAFILYWRIKADGDRALCRGSSPHLHRHPDRASWHRDCALRGARIDLSRPGIPRDLAQATVGGGVDAFAICERRMPRTPNAQQPWCPTFSDVRGCGG